MSLYPVATTQGFHLTRYYHTNINNVKGVTDTLMNTSLQCPHKFKKESLVCLSSYHHLDH